jgi:apolipoprotein N-acyltransferase
LRVIWPKYAAYVTEADTPTFIEKVASTAKRFDVYVATAFGGIAPSSPIPVSNRLIWIGPEGTVLDDHHKYRTVPGFEPPARPPKITPIETPYGRAAGVVCADADVPHILKRAGEAGISILAVPTQDWRCYSPDAHPRPASRSRPATRRGSLPGWRRRRRPGP